MSSILSWFNESKVATIAYEQIDTVDPATVPYDVIDTVDESDASSTKSHASQSPLPIYEYKSVELAIKVVEPTHKYELPVKKNASFMTGVIGRVVDDLFMPSLFKHWDNVAIAGGYVVDLLYGSSTSSDIDLFVYNTDTDQVKKIAEDVIALLKQPSTICETKAVRTIKTKDKTVQIINACSFADLDELLDSFDINCCKVAFDGYNLVIHPDASVELADRTIYYDNQRHRSQQTDERLLKYVTTKGFGLTAKKSTYDAMFPLSVFTESRGLEYVDRMYRLKKNPSLLADYNNLVIRRIPNLQSTVSTYDIRCVSACGDLQECNYLAMSKSGKRSAKLMEGNSLSCCVSTVREASEPANRFGLPVILWRIKSGDIPHLDELYASTASDMCGFHVTCYLIFYHQSEDFIMDFIKESHRLSSKNHNVYNLSYLELACLLNRLKLAKFFMTKETYRTAMRISLYEDNVDLYQLAYKSHCSDDRYLYKREDLIRHNSANLLKYLYDEEIPAQKSKSDAMATSKSDTIRQMLEACETDEEFFLKCIDPSSGQYDQIAWLQSHGTVELDKPDPNYLNVDMYIKMRELLYQYHNRDTNDRFRRYYYFLTQKFPDPINTVSLTYCDCLHKLLKVEHEKTLDPTYKFDDLFVNLLLIDLDDSDLLKQNACNIEMYKFLNTEKEYLRPRLEELRQELVQKENYITTYRELLHNTPDHDRAYSDNVLSREYTRTENAIGYTPDDIILWRTIMFYVTATATVQSDEDKTTSEPNASKIDWYSPMVVERRKSIKIIDRKQAIRKFLEPCVSDSIV